MNQLPNPNVLICLAILVVIVVAVYLYLRRNPGALAKLESTAKTDASSFQANVTSSLASLHAKVDNVHAAALAPVSVAISPAQPAAAAAAAPAQQAAAPAAPPASAAAPAVNPRTVPGGSTGFLGAFTTNVTAYVAAGSPYYDVNDYELTNQGAWTGKKADGSTIPEQKPDGPWTADAWFKGSPLYVDVQAGGAAVSQPFTMPPGKWQLLKVNDHGYLTESIQLGGATYQAGYAIEVTVPTAGALTVTLADPARAADAKYGWAHA